MKTADVISLLRGADPIGALEVSIGSARGDRSGWQTIASAQMLYGDTGARLVLHLAPSPAALVALGDLPAGALFEWDGDARLKAPLTAVKLYRVKGGNQRVIWLATGLRETVSPKTLVRPKFLPANTETGR